jgi:hypothetical protein
MKIDENLKASDSFKTQVLSEGAFEWQTRSAAEFVNLYADSMTILNQSSIQVSLEEPTVDPDLCEF